MVHPINGHTTPVPVPQSGKVAPTGGTKPAGMSFEEVLATRLGTSDRVTFSAHAKKRIGERGIELSSGELASIDQATRRAADKGAREALFLLGELGLVVNIKNRTVLTALDTRNMRNKVFTNIDSAVVIR